MSSFYQSFTFQSLKFDTLPLSLSQNWLYIIAVRKLDFSFLRWITEPGGCCPWLGQASHLCYWDLRYWHFIEWRISFWQRDPHLAWAWDTTRTGLRLGQVWTALSLTLQLSLSVIKHYLAPPNWRKIGEAKIPKSQLSEAQNFCWNFVSDFIIRFVFCLPQNREQ